MVQIAALRAHAGEDIVHQALVEQLGMFLAEADGDNLDTVLDRGDSCRPVPDRQVDCFFDEVGVVELLPKCQRHRVEEHRLDRFVGPVVLLPLRAARVRTPLGMSVRAVQLLLLLPRERPADVVRLEDHGANAVAIVGSFVDLVLHFVHVDLRGAHKVHHLHLVQAVEAPQLLLLIGHALVRGRHKVGLHREGALFALGAVIGAEGRQEG